MNREKDIINTISGILPRSQEQLNGLFESDAEIIMFNGKKLLFTVDDYSKEDRFREHDPYTLGWNLAVATISDILASGGVPKYYAHSMIFNDNTWDKKYISAFSEGVSAVLKKTNAFFIGGDTGTAQDWHYTGIAIGESPSPVQRTGARPGDLILMTGHVGAGNLEAALGLYSKNVLLKSLLNRYKTRLPIRTRESVLIREYASSCIDSSDGVMNALITLSELNFTGFELTWIPYLPKGLAACKILSQPRELLLAGECGEYELVFTVPEKYVPALLSKAENQQLPITLIGKMTENPDRTLKCMDRTIDFTPFEIRGRDHEDVLLYLEELTLYLNSHEKSRKKI